MAEGIESVKNRLDRTAAALAQAGVRYAVVGGNAVAAWVSRVDAAAVRNTRDVDIMLRREDLDRARDALEAADFAHRRVASLGKAASMVVFLDGPDAKIRDAVHILWAGEKAVPAAIAATPELELTDPGDGFELIPLEDLVRMEGNWSESANKPPIQIARRSTGERTVGSQPGLVSGFPRLTQFLHRLFATICLR